jgi:D-glycerate 3-kinase
VEDSADGWLRTHTALPGANRQALARLLPQLMGRIPIDRKTITGIAGAPGSGKSTLARLLVHLLEQSGTPACRLSLDDYYLPRARREQMAQAHHPLFRQRGVPGTHQLDRLMQDLDRVRGKDASGMKTPVFDKSTDDRAPESGWRTLTRDPVVIILEGWCVGAPPGDETGLAQALNATERLQDAGGDWRRRMHYSWTDYHLALQSRLDEVWYIRVPDWNSVIDWRWQQERELAVRGLERREDVQEFLGSFERIVRHMQATCGEWADVCLLAGRDHSIRLNTQTGAGL